MFPLPVPLVLVGAKWDTLASAESEKVKWLARGLRYFAHVNNADLVFGSTKEKGFADLKTLFFRLLFATEKAPKLQTEHGRALCVRAAQDKLSSIGEP